MRDEISVKDKLNFRNNFAAMKRKQELELAFAQAQQATEEEYFNETLRKRKSRIKRIERKEDLIKCLNRVVSFFKSLTKDARMRRQYQAIRKPKLLTYRSI